MFMLRGRLAARSEKRDELLTLLATSPRRVNHPRASWSSKERSSWGAGHDPMVGAGAVSGVRLILKGHEVSSPHLRT